MTALSQLVTSRLEVLKREGRDQKLVAADIHDRLMDAGEGRNADGGDPVARLEELLSKLKSGRGPEYTKAERFVFKTGARIYSFSGALGSTEQELRDAHARRSVLLDGDIPTEIRSYFETRALEPGSRVHVEHSDATTPSALLASARSIPTCLVVLSDRRWHEREFFAAADVATTRVTVHPRGWLLADYAELAPPPAPADPVLLREDRP